MSKTMYGFLAGAAAGALAGILLAPDKGSDTRKRIANKACDLTDSVKSSFNDFIDSIKETYANAKEDAGEFKDKAMAKMNAAKQEAKQEVKNALS